MSSDELAAMLGALIHLHRNEMGWSLRDLEATLPDVSASTLSRVENGRLPDIETFLQLVEWLGVSECALLFPEERNPLTALERLTLLLECDLGLDHDLVQAIVKIVRLVQKTQSTVR